MILRQLQKPAYQIYRQADHNFFQMPSEQAMAICTDLRSHGLHVHHPFPVILGKHSIELFPDTDVKAVQVLLDAWVASQAPPAAPAPKVDPKRSRMSMFGDG